MKRITNELDKIANELEKHKKLGPQDRLLLAKLIDEVSDSLDTIAKTGKWMLGDEDEKPFMKRYDEPGAYMFDEDEEYMKSFENPIEQRAVYEEYLRKHQPGYETRDLNTDVQGG